MPSQAVKNLRRERVQYEPADRQPPNDTHSDVPMPSGPSGGAGNQQAHDQIVKGLSVLADQYPEANDFLTKFEQMWSKWMGGKAGPSDEAGATGPQRMAPAGAPPGDASTQI